MNAAVRVRVALVAQVVLTYCNRELMKMVAHKIPHYKYYKLIRNRNTNSATKL